MVHPLKKYISRHTTVNMCQCIMGNVDHMKSCHAAYKSRESFDVHHTTRHPEQSAFPDHLKAGCFFLTKQFFSIKGRKDVDAIHLGKKGQFKGKISSNVVGAYKKGVNKIRTLKRNCMTAFQIFDITF